MRKEFETDWRGDAGVSSAVREFCPPSLPTRTAKPPPSFARAHSSVSWATSLVSQCRSTSHGTSHNMALAKQMPAVYDYPTDIPDDGSQTSYAMIVGPHAISDGPMSHHLGDIKDNGTGTIMVSEVAHAGITWLEPRDLSVKDMTFVTHVGQVFRKGMSRTSPALIAKWLICSSATARCMPSIKARMRRCWKRC